MPQIRSAGEQGAHAFDSRGERQRGRRTRNRADLLSDSPAAKIQRMLVLAERFRALATLKSDPARLADVLRNIIPLVRETFGSDPSLDWTARMVVQMAPDQQRCLRDLERLLQGLAYGSPDAWRGLGHAMDALLIQCLLFDSPASEEPAAANP